MNNDYFQTAMDKFPAVFHISGNKKIVGWSIIAAFALTYLTLVFIFLGPGLFAFYLAGLGLYVAIYIFLLKLGFNWLVYILAIGGSIISFIRNPSWMSLFVMMFFLWLALSLYFRTKARDEASERMQYYTEKEADHVLLDRFKYMTDESVLQTDDKIVDDETLDYTVKEGPVWDAKVNARKPTEFCPKCGFSVVQGEDHCSVCGHVFETKTEDPE